MERKTYELAKPIDDFEAGDVFEVTARYGNWHLYDLRLEPVNEGDTGSIELTEDRLELVSNPTESWGASGVPASS